MTSASDNLATLVDDMLQDADLGQDLELRSALISLGALAALPVPAPKGDLAALLGAAAPARAGTPAPAEQPEDDLARRRRRRHRPTALGLVLVAGMGLGVGGVAASSTAPGSNAVEHLLEEWMPWSRPATGAPAASGSHAPEPAAAGELTDAASTAAPGGAGQAGSRVFRLLRDAAGLSCAPAYAGPLKQEPAAAPKCGRGAAASTARGVEAGSSKDVAGLSGAERMPAGAAGASGAGTNGAGMNGAGTNGDGTPASDSPGGANAARPGQDPGSVENSVPAQAPSPGAGHGEGADNGRKGAAPAK